MAPATDPARRQKIVAVAGNPNSGKTTLFNALTGAHAKIGNYPGITVESRTAEAELPRAGRVTLVDVPGTYSLTARSPDEEVAINSLLGRKGLPRPDAVLVVLDAVALERSLFFLMQVMEFGLPVIAVVNMIDAARGEGIDLHFDALRKEFGISGRGHGRPPPPGARAAARDARRRADRRAADPVPGLAVGTLRRAVRRPRRLRRGDPRGGALQPAHAVGAPRLRAVAADERDSAQRARSPAATARDRAGDADATRGCGPRPRARGGGGPLREDRPAGPAPDHPQPAPQPPDRAHRCRAHPPPVGHGGLRDDHGAHLPDAVLVVRAVHGPDRERSRRPRRRAARAAAGRIPARPAAGRRDRRRGRRAGVPAADPVPVPVHFDPRGHRVPGARGLPDRPAHAPARPARPGLRPDAQRLRLRHPRDHGHPHHRQPPRPLPDDHGRAPDQLLGPPAGLHPGDRADLPRRAEDRFSEHRHAGAAGDLRAELAAGPAGRGPAGTHRLQGPPAPAAAGAAGLPHARPQDRPDGDVGALAGLPDHRRHRDPGDDGRAVGAADLPEARRGTPCRSRRGRGPVRAAAAQLRRAHRRRAGARHRAPGFRLEDRHRPDRRLRRARGLRRHDGRGLRRRRRGGSGRQHPARGHAARPPARRPPRLDAADRGEPDRLLHDRHAVHEHAGGHPPRDRQLGLDPVHAELPDRRRLPGLPARLPGRPGAGLRLTPGGPLPEPAPRACAAGRDRPSCPAFAANPHRQREDATWPPPGSAISWPGRSPPAPTSPSRAGCAPAGTPRPA
ncbi:MAG: 50S ribosome-binding GTPase [bacterium]|nr:50S ribosome-binding GTPase [bacterium]